MPRPSAPPILLLACLTLLPACGTVYRDTMRDLAAAPAARLDDRRTESRESLQDADDALDALSKALSPYRDNRAPSDAAPLSHAASDAAAALYNARLRILILRDTADDATRDDLPPDLRAQHDALAPTLTAAADHITAFASTLFSRTDALSPTTPTPPTPASPSTDHPALAAELTADIAALRSHLAETIRQIDTPPTSINAHPTK